MLPCCKSCRHWFPVSDRVGTCRVRPPQKLDIDPDWLLEQEQVERALEELSTKRWPATLAGHLCAKHSWRCQSAERDCRGVVVPASLGHEMRGELFCPAHHEEKRRRPGHAA